MTNPQEFTYQRMVGDARLEGRIAPCCWMYPNLKSTHTQLMVTLGESIPATLYVEIGVDEVTPADLVAALDAVEPIPCSRCGAPAFNPETIETNRGGLCEDCFMADLDKEVAEITKKENDKIAKNDRRMLKRGFTHRVTAWVHAGGDDYPMDIYYAAAPTPDEIVKELKRKRSRVLDDYTVTRLTTEVKAVQ